MKNPCSWRSKSPSGGSWKSASGKFDLFFRLDVDSTVRRTVTW
jgi:hypothetical protein